MSRKPAREDRRIQIMEALHDCLIEKPFHRTTIKDIADMAGVNHGLLHYYFENKEDILINYVEFTANKFDLIFDELFSEEFEDPQEEIKNFEEKCQWILNEVSFNQEYTRIYTEIWAIALYNEKLKEKLKEIYTKSREQLAKGIKKFVHSQAMVDRISLTLMAFWEGMSVMSIFFDKQDMVDKIEYQGILKALNTP
jgi:AcrR family transcriptional regulator